MTASPTSPARDLADDISRELAAAGVPSPEADARWLVEALTGVDPWREPDHLVAVDRRLTDAVDRRSRREPLQLVVGSTAFLDLTITCRAGVFVPRPETEVLAELAISEAAARTAPVVVEACTGTGAVAGAVAVHVTDATVVATDVSPAAVALARDNVARVLGGAPPPIGATPVTDQTARRGHLAAPAAGRVDVRLGDLFAPVPRALAGRVDIVVANPPYLPAGDRETWMPEVAVHDPIDALVGGPDGNEIVERLLREAPRWLRTDGVMLLEIDARRAREIVALARRLGWCEVTVVDDLAGAPRFVVARRHDAMRGEAISPRPATAARKPR